MPAATNLFTLTELASYLQADLDTATATIAMDVATAACQNAARTHILQRSTTVELAGATLALTLPETPTTAVANVTGIDVGAYAPADYERHGQELTLTTGARWDRFVTVAYTAGLYTIPADVKGVALAVAGRVYANPGGVRSETIQDYSYTNAGSDNDLVSGVALMPHERAILRGYFGGDVALIGAP